MRDEMKESQHSLTRADYEAPVCQRLCQAEHVPLEEVSLADWRPKISECHSNVVEANLGATAVRNSGAGPAFRSIPIRVPRPCSSVLWRDRAGISTSIGSPSHPVKIPTLPQRTRQGWGTPIRGLLKSKSS